MATNRLIVIVAPLHSVYSKREEEEVDTMNNQMGSALPNEKLDRNNFASWEYKMHQDLVRQGYWTYIKGAHEEQPGLTTPEYATWQQDTSRILYYLTTCVHDHMLSHIRRCKDTQRGVGKSQEDFRRKHIRAQASTPTRVEQHKTKRHVHVGLHRQDKEHLLAPSTSTSTMMRWCKFASAASHRGSARCEPPF